jgi:glucose/arabinose dehydrogenase
MHGRLRNGARIVLLAALALGCGRGVSGAAVAGRAVELARLELPPGFDVDFYSREVPGARSLALSPSGVVYVGSRKEGTVYALVDRDHDFRAEQVHVLAKGLEQPNGVAFRDGSLYVAEVSRVLRFDDVERQLGKPPQPVVLYDRLPRETHHGWRYMRFGPDGWLWLGIGAPCNICEVSDPHGTVSRLSADGKRLEVYARGVRNTVGFDWQPGTNTLWFTDNGRDWMGDERPPDELDRAPRAGLHFGFPYCHGGDIPDPDHGSRRRCAELVAPALKLGPHVAAIGMRFYRGKQFPAAYRGSIFIAEHGSWNRSQPIGYRVMAVDVDGERASNYRVFASGWLQGGEGWGRPVDLVELPDGSLLLSDDRLGAVYRISYRGK